MQMLHDWVKEGGTNSRLYKSLFEAPALLGGRVLDEDWVSRADEQFLARRKQMEKDLNTHLGNQARALIRRTNVELAALFHARGELTQALGCHNRAYDYSTAAEKMEHHLISAQLNLEQGHWANVFSCVRKARSLTSDLCVCTPLHWCCFRVPLTVSVVLQAKGQGGVPLGAVPPAREAVQGRRGRLRVCVARAERSLCG